jgi:hypothetical protein
VTCGPFLRRQFPRVNDRAFNHASVTTGYVAYASPPAIIGRELVLDLDILTLFRHWAAVSKRQFDSALLTGFPKHEHHLVDLRVFGHHQDDNAVATIADAA